VVRFLGIIVALLVFAYGAVLASAAASARPGVPGDAWRPSGVTAVEAPDDSPAAQAPLAPTDVDDDDDDDDDDQEAFTEPSRVVPWRFPVTLRTAPPSETIRPSLGHPRGIDDPPRS
jgi:hypothetical protein